MLTPEQLARVTEATLFDRLPEVGDVVSAALFFCSEHNRSVTGQFSPWISVPTCSPPLISGPRPVPYRVDIEPGLATDYLRGLGRDVIVIGDEIFHERFATLSCPVLALRRWRRIRRSTRRPASSRPRAPAV